LVRCLQRERAARIPVSRMNFVELLSSVRERTSDDHVRTKN
jgi:hypothetical protein